MNLESLRVVQTGITTTAEVTEYARDIGRGKICMKFRFERWG